MSRLARSDSHRRPRDSGSNAEPGHPPRHSTPLGIVKVVSSLRPRMTGKSIAPKPGPPAGQSGRWIAILCKKPYMVHVGKIGDRRNVPLLYLEKTKSGNVPSVPQFVPQFPQFPKPLANHRVARSSLAARTLLASTRVFGLLPQRLREIRCARASLTSSVPVPKLPPTRLY